MGKTSYEVRNGAAWFTIMRPEKRNAVDYEVMEELRNTLVKAKEDESVKLLVITGSGENAFCSGGDLSVFHGLKTAEEASGMLSEMADILLDLFFFPKPTVACLNGSAVGGGCEIASACDIRIGYEDIGMGFIQGSLGITTGWGGTAFLMHRLASPQALDLLISAEKITSQKAMEMGFLQAVFSRREKERIQLFLDRYLKQSLGVLKGYKSNYLSGINVDSLKAQVYQEVGRCALLWASEEHHQAVEAFQNKAK